jgi:hypothetical protein
LHVGVDGLAVAYDLFGGGAVAAGEEDARGVVLGYFEDCGFAYAAGA